MGFAESNEVVEKALRPEGPFWSLECQTPNTFLPKTLIWVFILSKLIMLNQMALSKKGTDLREPYLGWGFRLKKSFFPKSDIIGIDFK